MKRKCEYCSGYVKDSDERCPSCGAQNKNHARNAGDVPRTIEELKQFCIDHDMPARDMRFFIGEDYRKPKAFGIYKDGNTVILYKNKADGERVVRYEGDDEAYAVNELFMRLKEEMANQIAKGNVVHKKAAEAVCSSAATPKRNFRASARRFYRANNDILIGIVLNALFFVLIAVVLSIFLHECGNGTSSKTNTSFQEEEYRRHEPETKPTEKNGNDDEDWFFYYGMPQNYNAGYDYDYDYDYSPGYSYDYDYDDYDFGGYDSDYGYSYDTYDSYDSYDYDSYDSYDSWGSDSWTSYDSYDYSGWDSNTTDWGSDW